MFDYKWLVTCSLLTIGWMSLLPDATRCSAPVPTLVTPHLEIPIEAGRNTLFCSAFQMAWNRMRDEIIEEDIRLEKPLDLVRFLNRSISTESDISENDYLAMAGYGRENIADRINRALAEKFGHDAPIIDSAFNDDDVILAYAFLNKMLAFTHAFENFSHPLLFLSNDRPAFVDAFGVGHYSDSKHRKLKEQVEILHYEHMGEAIIRLKSSHPDDEIILARVEPEATLIETFEKVNRLIDHARRHANVAYLDDNDLLQIPKLDLTIDHRFEPLLGLYLRNENFQSYFIAEARQDIRFRLDECGATMTAEGTLALKKGPPPNYKILVFNHPFLLYLKKKDGAYPYFALWVENSEFMIKPH